VEERTAYNVRPIALIDSSFESQPGLAQEGKLKEKVAVALATGHAGALLMEIRSV
jgi:hypothetical protein